MCHGESNSLTRLRYVIRHCLGNFLEGRCGLPGRQVSASLKALVAFRVAGGQMRSGQANGSGKELRLKFRRIA